MKAITIIIMMVVYIGSVLGDCHDDQPEIAVNAPPGNNIIIIIILLLLHCINIECLILTDCKAWYDLGVNQSGVYSVNPDKGEPFQV